MPRVKPGKTTRKWHKKVLKMAKGTYGARRKHYATALVTIMRAGNFAYRDRRNRKREFRRLWIQRINAASRVNGLNYHTLMHGLRAANVTLDRKQLSELAQHDPAAFAKLADMARAALPSSSGAS